MLPPHISFAAHGTCTAIGALASRYGRFRRRDRSRGYHNVSVASFLFRVDLASSMYDVLFTPDRYATLGLVD